MLSKDLSSNTQEQTLITMLVFQKAWKFSIKKEASSPMNICSNQISWSESSFLLEVRLIQTSYYINLNSSLLWRLSGYFVSYLSILLALAILKKQMLPFRFWCKQWFKFCKKISWIKISNSLRQNRKWKKWWMSL